ncbi:hypothetical protein FC97_GL000278 [Companilactobacillus kimchii DSM 13961 = JCM 10707]|uniref:Alpha/beta hydrolase n=1 Tax=Companilactobacillus kimchii DSM 13961 = JCM 10707 TaxID=1423765 RepID=A0ABR5NUM5_9LACO|nr:hypothetical protein FC97_GL000278 [Companilactobacillus kimchii DSM 13961 = JCM 10707]
MYFNGVEILKKVILYVHGKGGSAAEAERFKRVCPDYDIVGIDYKEYLPWVVEKQIKDVYEQVSPQYDQVLILANSIGSYFSMLTKDITITKALFISPLLNMEQYLLTSMKKNNITEAELRDKGEIVIGQEKFSWQSLQYVRDNPLDWQVPTEILYGEHDDHTSKSLLKSFVENHNANVTVMKDGQHRFHTRPQLAFLDNWLQEKLNK